MVMLTAACKNLEKLDVAGPAKLRGGGESVFRCFDMGVL